ncbi:hypothetical protein RB195_017328 [Necator americanus]|uniref:Uncharacterized protein n=1 Tax=Necator americanus TaxID=51031 RepID=A0ABR1C4Q3_NECAM
MPTDERRSNLRLLRKSSILNQGDTCMTFVGGVGFVLHKSVVILVDLHEILTSSGHFSPPPSTPKTRQYRQQLLTNNSPRS